MLGIGGVVFVGVGLVLFWLSEKLLDGEVCCWLVVFVLGFFVGKDE